MAAGSGGARNGWRSVIAKRRTSSAMSDECAEVADASSDGRGMKGRMKDGGAYGTARRRSRRESAEGVDVDRSRASAPITVGRNDSFAVRMPLKCIRARGEDIIEQG